MSQPPPGRKPAYPRSFPGLLAAMLVTVLVVLAFVGFRAFFRDNAPTPLPVVDWAPRFHAAQQDGRIQVLSPVLPRGWKAREVDYASGELHLAMNTDDAHYVGLEQADQSLAALVQQYVDPNADPGKDVTIAGRRWRTWTDAGGDYAVGRTAGSGRDSTSYLVVGSATPAQIRALAATLH